MTGSLEGTFAGVSREIRAILERALAGREPSVAEAVALCSVRGPELRALAATADAARRRVRSASAPPCW